MPLKLFVPMLPDLEKQYSVQPSVARSTQSRVIHTRGAVRYFTRMIQKKAMMKGRNRPVTTSAFHASNMSAAYRNAVAR